MSGLVWQWLGGMALRGGVLLGVLALIYGYHWNAKRLAYNEGYAAALAKIEEANREADRKADVGEDDVARCYRSGGRWLRHNGTCQPAVRHPD